MILTDTGPLLALLDKDDANHARCFTAAQAMPATPMLTTWPCFTEAMYLLGSVGGYSYQAALWSLRQSGGVVLHELKANDADRMAGLMNRYQNVPMDLADASLVVTAEAMGLRKIFSIDSDFLRLPLERWIGVGSASELKCRFGANVYLELPTASVESRPRGTPD